MVYCIKDNKLNFVNPMSTVIIYLFNKTSQYQWYK